MYSITACLIQQQKSHACEASLSISLYVGGGAPEVRQEVLRFAFLQTKKNQRVTEEQTTGIRHPSKNFYRLSCLRFEFTTFLTIVVLSLRKD